jgi:F1F0 ATPase subunit 2
MNTPWILAALTMGVLLGAFYFGGLWMTVRRLAISRQPALLLFASFVVRMSVVLIGFYTVSGGRWQPIVACLVGFLIARMLLVRRLGDLALLAKGPSSVTARRTPQ